MKKAVFFAAAALAAAVPAGAVTTIGYSSGSATPPADLSVFEDFDGAPANGTTVFDTDVTNVAARPTGSTGNFGVVQGGTTQTFTFSRAATRFGFLIGTPDSYNSLTLNFADNTSQTFNGLAGGTPGGFLAFRRGAGDSRIVSATFGSDTNSFEFDNLAIGGVPEPTTWAMMILGFGVIGAAIRRRRTVGATLRTA